MTRVTAGLRPAGRAGGNARRRLMAGGLALAVAAVGLITATRLTAGSGPHRAASSKATTTTTVQRTDLSETTPVTGTVGFASPYTIVQPGGTSSQTVTQAQQSVAQAQRTIVADHQALADTDATDAEGVARAQQALASARAALTADATRLDRDQADLSAAQQKKVEDCQASGRTGNDSSGRGQSGGATPCATDTSQVNTRQQQVTSDEQKVNADQAAARNDEGQLTSAQQERSQDTGQMQAKVAADQMALDNDQAALVAARTAATDYDPTSRYTALPAIGEVIETGQSIWSVDGRLVPLLPGALTPWRGFNAGMSDGADVAALDQALVALGDANGLTVSDAFTDATGAAIDRLQRSLGLPETGSLALGSMIFVPTTVRVTVVHPLVGSPVAGGQPVLDVTSTTAVVNIPLPVNQTSRVKVGDPVSVNLPDGTTGQGTITAVGTVATNTTPSNSGSNNTSATVSVTVSLTTSSPAGSLDQAPVTVNITNTSAHQVLAVPTTALLALAGGGYAVEVVEPDGSHRLVAVTTGIFDDQTGLVQVSGTGLAVGQQVVAAA